MRGSSGTHISLRVYLEEPDRLRSGDDVAEMLGLQTDPSAPRRFEMLDIGTFQPMRPEQ